MAQDADRPLVTVVIPVRNEEGDIGDCLRSIAEQRLDPAMLEVLVVDGGSHDRTVAAAEAALDRLGLPGRVVVNPRSSTPSNLNLGLEQAQGEILCRVDARSRVPTGYIARCIEVLAERGDVAVVGGAQVAAARQGAGVVARGIARALRNPYATGLARYRRGRASGPTDTVYLGTFRTSQLREADGWDERFATNQDYDLNRRMGAIGTVWYDHHLEVAYLPREELAELARQYRRFGRWKSAGWLEAGGSISPRQLVLVVSVPVAATVGVGLLRRWPRSAIVGVVVAAVLLDRASPGSAPVPERALGLVASATIGGAWWFGMAEQIVRYARGHRLLDDVPK